MMYTILGLSIVILSLVAATSLPILCLVFVIRDARESWMAWYETLGGIVLCLIYTWLAGSELFEVVSVWASLIN